MQVALLGCFNGQSLGSSIEDFVSSHALEVGLNTSGVENGASAPPQCHHESIHIKNGSSNIDVLMRTTPGVEYIKVSDCIAYVFLLCDRLLGNRKFIDVAVFFCN